MGMGGAEKLNLGLAVYVEVIRKAPLAGDQANIFFPTNWLPNTKLSHDETIPKSYLKILSARPDWPSGVGIQFT